MCVKSKWLLDIGSCVSHSSPTFSYTGKMDKRATLLKTGSDNIVIFVLYGTSSVSCQGGEFVRWFREAGLSEPPKVIIDR
jgi:hypothetical protein